MRGWMIMAGALLALAAPAAAQDMAQASMPGVKIAVADMARTAAFYQALGMQAGPRYNDHETALEWRGPAQGSRIIMVKDEGGRMPRGGSFLMIGVPDIDAALARLKAAGFAWEGTPKVTPRASILMLADPDGNRIELLGRPKP